MQELLDKGIEYSFWLRVVDLWGPEVRSVNNDIPMLNLLSSNNIGRLTEMATQIFASAANIDTLTRTGHPQPGPLSLNSRPSEMIGQSITNAISPTLSKVAQISSSPANRGQLLLLQSGTNKAGNSSPLMDLAEAFLGPATSSNRPPLVKAKPFYVKDDRIDDWLPTIRDLAPGARSNFGIPKGEGCLPFLSEFMRMAYGNCVKVADEKAWDTWGNQINNALFGGKVDFISAAKETCKRGAERQYCGQLRQVISECDILGSLQVAMEMQRAVQRCDDFSGVIDQNPMQVLNQVNGIIGGEFAQGFLHKFLG